MRMRLRPARSWPMQASNPDRAAGHATIAISLPFHLPASLQTERTSCPATSDRLFERLAANRLRPTQVATCLVVPLTGLLSLLDLVVVAEVEPLQTSVRITHLDESGPFCVHGIDEQIFGADEQIFGPDQSD